MHNVYLTALVLEKALPGRRSFLGSLIRTVSHLSRRLMARLHVYILYVLYVVALRLCDVEISTAWLVMQDAVNKNMQSIGFICALAASFVFRPLQSLKKH